jgi:excisionase family DNA binding protein
MTHLANNRTELLTLREAAVWLAISLRQLRRLIDEGRISVVRISERAPRVRVDEIRSYIESVTSRSVLRTQV